VTRHATRTVAERLRDDRGSLTAALVIWTPIFMILAAFVVDTGYLISRRDQVDNIAEQAARRVADDLDQSAIRENPVRLAINLDGPYNANTPATGTCVDDAKDYLAAAGLSNVTVTSCTVTGNPPPQMQPAPVPPPVLSVPTVTVTVQMPSNPLFLGLVDSQPQTVTGTGTATPVIGQ
jgi:Flp pilus assembly protein TadG